MTMNITPYSFLTAVLWFDAVILIYNKFHRQKQFLLNYGLWPAAFALGAGCLRLFFPFDVPVAKVVHSWVFLPALHNFSKNELCLTGNFTISLESLLLSIWAIGTIIAVTHVGIKLGKDYAVMRSCPVLPDKRIVKIILSNAPANCPQCRILICPHIGSPLMAGFFTPHFLLPCDIFRFSDLEIQYISQHEWYHFRRHDMWIKLIVEFLICVLWWNFPIYLLRSIVDSLLEISCDLHLTKCMGNKGKASYLETIAKSIQREARNYSTNYFASQLLGMKSKIGIKQRFLMVAQYNPAANKSIIWKSAVITSVIFVLSLLFIAQPYYAPPIENDYSCLSKENSYLLLEQDGTYSLYVDGVLFAHHTEEEIYYPPLCNLPIKGD